MARVLISMPEEFLNRIDQVADGENRSRSELIREALRTYIYKQKIKESTLEESSASIFLYIHFCNSFYICYIINLDEIIKTQRKMEMQLEFLYSKIHRATVTDANLNYVGSITIDETLLKAANIREWQKVEILDVNNGERFQTYVIKGKADSGQICLNGAAARKVQPGDKVIIVTYGQFEEKELENFKPTIIIVDENNKIIEKK